ncbi:MAG TPA: glycoside hydrolase family 31 protein [Cryobacterium sp.]|nr:glycoside hydrolase family 31 protein [Cryobacterium sp.]
MTPPTDTLTLTLLPGEKWWGGAVADGQKMPFGAEPHRRDLGVNAGFLADATQGANQSAPVLLSSRGRVVWSEHPFTFSFENGCLSAAGRDLVQTRAGDSLREAFRYASAAWFPPSGRAPAVQMFTGPQYNTWIELPYAPTQQGVLDYVRGILDAGFPPGPVMIDDTWSPGYGTWTFDPVRFPDPGEMTRQLREWGCPVMLWLVPFVSPDTAVFRDLHQRGLLVRGADGEVAIRRWWNGYSAVLDATNPATVAWLGERLRALIEEHGVAGFKFDGGDLRDYREGDITFVPTGRTGQCEAWARVGLEFPFNEYRAGWKMGGQALAERLHDKPPVWGAGGLDSLIPESIAQGLIGSAFVCPDMVGGGDLAHYADGTPVDQELFVRYAQCAALFPMVQFSLAPWRVLALAHLDAVQNAIALRQSLMPEILALVREAATTGEPILRALGYHYPGCEQTRDQFLVGEDILVAPVLEQGARTRTVVFPPGRWVAAGGSGHVGPSTAELPVQLGTLPWFRRERA